MSPGTQFQFTPLREGRRVVVAHVVAFAQFQFTPLREGRHARTVQPPRRHDFNSRPSARGDNGGDWEARGSYISIHAPPRGATENKNAFLGGIDISIHAPPRGATARGWGKKRWKTSFQFTPLREGRHARREGEETTGYFNSRPSARGDPWKSDGGGAINGISIHAPPRGATKCFLVINYDKDISIHAPPRGATTEITRRRKSTLFQFTPLREGRPASASSACARTRNFNSRPSARGDGKRYAISANLLFNPYKSAWLNNRATQFVEIILVIFHRIIA